MSDAPLGVRGRNSNNDLIREAIGWDYTMTLEEGLSRTYAWINGQVQNHDQYSFVSNQRNSSFYDN